MLKSLVIASVMLSTFTCEYTRTDDDNGDDNVRIRVVSTPQLPAEPTVPVRLADVDLDGWPDLIAPDRWYLAREEGWEEVEPGPPPPDAGPLRAARFEDIDGDGRIDRIWLDGEIFGLR